MIILKHEQLSILKQKIDDMLSVLKTYDTNTTAKFRPTLQMISNNIDQCMKNDFDGIEELSRYVNEDWRSVCVGKSGIENWYLKIADLNLKGRYNKIFDEIALAIDKMLDTNFLIPRKWYDYDELIRLGQQYKDSEKDWNLVIQKLQESNEYNQSPMKVVPNDIWSFAKMLCLAESDESLQEWFLRDVPAFGYLSPVQILQIENGDNILRTFMFGIPF